MVEQRNGAVGQRYGELTPGRRRLLAVAAAVALVGAVVLAGWLSLGRGPTVTWQDIAFRIRSDAAVDVTFEVGVTGGLRLPGRGRDTDRDTERDTDRAAVCRLEALNTLRTVVGRRDVTVPLPAGARQRVTVGVRTGELATTGLVRSCRLAG